MTFPHPIIYFRNTTLAGLAGIVTGTVIHTIRKYPETGKKTLSFSCLSGCIGLGVGYSFGLIRKKHVYVYSLATGVNFLIVPLVFFGIRQMVETGDAIAIFLPKERAMELTIKDPYALSVFSGTMTAFLASLYSIKRSLKSSVLFMMTGSFVAASGQFTYSVINNWRIRKAMQIHYPELFEKQKEVTWEEWLNDLVSRKRKLSLLDDKIVQLEMEIELLEKEESELVKEQR